MEILKNEEMENVSGGYEMVSDPIYKLTANEVTYLKEVGYKLTATKSGNYRIKDNSGKMADSNEIQIVCKTINKLVNKKPNLFDILFG